MSLQIKFISEDSKVVTYGYELETDKLYIHFNKELKTVGIIYMRFIFQNYDETWTTQEENIKYSCKYGCQGCTGNPHGRHAQKTKNKNRIQYNI